MPASTRIRDDIRYGYAVGRVRVLDGKLLSRATFERLLDAPDLKEQKRVLAETHVGRYLEGADSAEQVERALETSLADLYDDFLEGAALPAAVVRYFQIPHDFANLRAALKARVLGIPADGLLSGLGSVPADSFERAGELPDEFAELIGAWDEAEEAPALDGVELEVDRALFAALADAARESRVRFLRELTALRVDVANARVLLRARAKAMPAPEVTRRMLPGGTPALAALATGASKMTADELATAIVKTRALGRTTEDDFADLERFDLVGDSLVAERMLAARRAAGGAEPVLAYVLAREAEVLVLRALLVGRLSGLGAETVRARMRERL
jgi:V/A-type H+-transporting ATPase subunit C